jgi:CubicO group peptidase (beta-lactamase class C family)
MKRFAVVIVVLVGCAQPHDDNQDKVMDPRFNALARAVKEDLEDNLATAASVAVWLDGEVTFVSGFGTLNDGRTPDRDTLFMIGSDTKKLTAIALLRAVEHGDATLDTTVADVLPDLHMTHASAFEGATIRQLLSHQGGIVDGTEDTDHTTDAAFATYVYGDFASEYYPLAPPGRIWNYSNPNFSIAGFMNQALDGRLWPDIVEEDVFPALGMSRSVARKSEVDGNHALGIHGASGRVTDLDDTWESAFVRPAGLVWSTPSDQMRVARFLVDGDPALLSDALRAEITSSQVSTYPDMPGGYGFGLSIDRGFYIGSDYYDVPIWSHGGNTITHTSTFFILPEQRFAISILSNGYGDDFTRTLVEAITTLVSLPSPTTAPQPPAFEAADLDGLTGTYHDEFNVGDVIVTRVGDALEIAMPLLDEYEIPYSHSMSPLSTHVWLANIQDTQLDLSFIDGPDGETYLRNRAFVAIRPAATTLTLMRAPRPHHTPDLSRLARQVAVP